MREITTAEAIGWFEGRKAVIAMPLAKAMYDKAIEALRAQMEEEKNEPVKHGRWVVLEPAIGLFVCTICGHKILRAECKYCPNCGAKMDGGETNENHA